MVHRTDPDAPTRTVVHTKRGLGRVESERMAKGAAFEEAAMRRPHNPSATMPPPAWARRVAADYSPDIEATAGDGKDRLIPLPEGRSLRIVKEGARIRLTVLRGSLPIMGATAEVLAIGRVRVSRTWDTKASRIASGCFQANGGRAPHSSWPSEYESVRSR